MSEKVTKNDEDNLSEAQTIQAGTLASSEGYSRTSSSRSRRTLTHPLPPGHGTPIIAIFNSPSPPNYEFHQPDNIPQMQEIIPKFGDQWDYESGSSTDNYANIIFRDTKIASSASSSMPHSGSISYIVGELKHSNGIWAPNPQNQSAVTNNLVPYVTLHLAALNGDWATARNFLRLNPEAVRAKITKGSETALHIAAGAKHTMFVEELVNLMIQDDLELKNDVGNTALYFAAVSGIKRIAEVMVNKNPRLPQIRGSNNSTPLHMATLLGHREMVWYLYGKTDAILTDHDRVGLLIAAITADLYGKCCTDRGAALQLRREMHWFKEVEKMVQPLYKEMKNSDGKTPQIVFTEEHKKLLREGEKWMKGTATSCMVVATLIATVMFAIFSTVPGGYENNKGIPIFLKSKAFILFAVSDAVSLISSTTSILSFLSILTSRYAEGDFLHSLPNRLIVGLATLFISIATMMITFVATLFIVLGHGFEEIKVPIALVAGVPVSFYALLQFPLLADMISHAYISRHSFRRSNHLLH